MVITLSNVEAQVLNLVQRQNNLSDDAAFDALSRGGVDHGADFAAVGLADQVREWVPTESLSEHPEADLHWSSSPVLPDLAHKKRHV